MSKEKDKGLDDLFRKKLEDPVDKTGYREEDWTALEQMLDRHKKKKGIIYWLPYISSVAALLLLFLGWWNFRPHVTRGNPESKPQAVNSPRSNTGINGGSRRQPTDHTPNKSARAATFTANSKLDRKSSTSKFLFTTSADGARRTAGSVEAGVKDATINQSNETLSAKSLLPAFGQERIIAERINFADVPQAAANQKALQSSSINDATIAKRKSGFRPQYALSVLAAPDINGVGSFQQSKVGSNVGLLFSVGVSKKLTISTGALYSDKPYITAFENYHTPYKFQVNPVNVAASCKMLDIPINIGYQLFNKHQNKIYVGTGLSSYLMLQESYKFNYADPYVTGPSNFKVPHSSGYFFGELNLNATYERQLNSKVGISLQPYLKLPLTNIGYSQSRLQSTGVAVGLTWNLNH